MQRTTTLLAARPAALRAMRWPMHPRFTARYSPTSHANGRWQALALGGLLLLGSVPHEHPATVQQAGAASSGNRAKHTNWCLLSQVAPFRPLRLHLRRRLFGLFWGRVVLEQRM